MNKKLLKLAILFAVFATIPPSAHAGLSLTSQHCLEGSQSERWVQARAIVAALRGAEEWSSVDTIQKTAKVDLNKVIPELGKYGDARECEFANNAKFDNDYELVRAVATQFYKKKKEKALPTWLNPGFKAVLSGFDSDNALFIEMTEKGFVFHDCESSDSNVVAPTPNEACPKMFNSSIYVPAEQMFANSVGAKHVVLMSLKIVAEVGVVALSVFDSALGNTSSNLINQISALAGGGATLVNETFGPQPVTDATQLYQGERAISDMIKFGQISKGGTIVTRILPFTWAELKGSVNQMVEDIFKQDYHQMNQIDRHPKNPKDNGQNYPGLDMEQDFHTRINQESLATPTPASVSGDK